MSNPILTKLKSIWISDRNNLWNGVSISRDATIEGNTKSITICEGTVIESDAVLSAKYGGSINIGKNCFIRRIAMLLTYGGNITLGDYCGVNIYSILYGHGGLQIGDYVQFATHTVVIPANHGSTSLEIPIWKQTLSKRDISIEDDAWVGANVTILDGVKIASGAVIGAGSVATKDIHRSSVNVGNPTNVIKFRTDRQQ